MTTWTTEYEPVDAPTKSKKGWKYPYNGDDWPVEDDWYWVWACKPYSSPDSVFLIPQKAWWDGQKQRFLALGDETVYAWHKAIPVQAVKPGKPKAVKMKAE